MSTGLGDVQRVVLHGSAWEAARHLALDFSDPITSAPRFLCLLKQGQKYWPAAAGAQEGPATQVSIGFSRRGLEHARVPDYILSLFALKSPAFHAGAAMRAAGHLGPTGGRPQDWREPFRFRKLDAVISVHGKSARAVDDAMSQVWMIAREARVGAQDLKPARRLPPPEGEEKGDKALWTHFGFRDGLSRLGIHGWTRHDDMEKCLPESRHQCGEFVLGYPQDSGANPWIAGPDMRVWPEQFRSFFRNGSFGVLHQIEQHVELFEKFVNKTAERMKRECLPLNAADIKAKLCGRSTAGVPMGASARPDEDFNYEHDPEGYGCPFGAHVRRMNPRGGDVAHSVRRRPLLRRGLPYGLKPGDEECGLMGQFFCASIEDQFEHLVGQWADSVPLGSSDIGGARDPMFGAHAPTDGAFFIPMQGRKPIKLRGMEAFATTVGLAYLFYPSLSTLEGIARNDPWLPDEYKIEGPR
jgi:deferrochelatase/peroxidase EfeB